MSNKITDIKIRVNLIIFEKVPYNFLYWLIYAFGIFKNVFKIIRYYFVDFSKIKLLNPSVQIDLSTMCQLKCPICPTSRGINRKGTIGWGYLKFKDFKEFVDRYPFIRNIELSNWGEIFLNPELELILKYANSKKINLYALSGVNLNDAKVEALEALVKYRMRYLNVSIDGAFNKTYKKYRIGGDLKKVFRNIEWINKFKKKYNSKYPRLVWQFIVMGTNEKDLPLARKLAHQLGMSFFVKLNRVPSCSAIKDKEFVRKHVKLKVSSRNEFMQKYKRLYVPNCYLLWNAPQINWDGKLLGCNRNLWGDFGNVFRKGLSECLGSEKYVYAKKMLLGKKKARDDIPCSKCPVYAFIQRNPLKKIEIIVNNNVK